MESFQRRNVKLKALLAPMSLRDVSALATGSLTLFHVHFFFLLSILQRFSMAASGGGMGGFGGQSARFARRRKVRMNEGRIKRMTTMMIMIMRFAVVAHDGDEKCDGRECLMLTLVLWGLAFGVLSSLILKFSVLFRTRYT